MWDIVIIVHCHCCQPHLLVDVGEDEGDKDSCQPPPHLHWLLIWVRVRAIVMLRE